MARTIRTRGVRRSYNRLHGWWSHAGVQVRSAIAATALQALVVAAAGAVLLFSLLGNLTRSIDESNASTADSVAAQVTADVLTGVTDETVEGREDLRAAVDAAARRRTFVQVLDADGVVIANSDDLNGATRLTPPAATPGTASQSELDLPLDDDPSRVLTTGGEVDGQRFTVIVGQSLEPVENSFETTLVILAVGVPLVLLVVAAATFLFVGHALTPVGAIRRAVENITGSDLTERVPVPPGRDEVARLAGTMNAMLERLDTAARVQRQFVADASHELRSPIATLQAGADIARLMSDSTGTEELVELVSGEARRLERLVADLLLLARSDDRGPRAPEAAEELDLDDLVEAEVSRLRASTRLRVVVRLSPTRVVGNAHDLSRLLRNLTDNAVSHAQQKVEIELRREGGDAVLEVANDGDPIPVEDRERVFDRFVRLDESRTRDAGGSGLGLAIVREISTAHHGRVQVVDTGCHEARFRLVLPITLLPDAE